MPWNTAQATKTASHIHHLAASHLTISNVKAYIGVSPFYRLVNKKSPPLKREVGYTGVHLPQRKQAHEPDSFPGAHAVPSGIPAPRARLFNCQLPPYVHFRLLSPILYIHSKVRGEHTWKRISPDQNSSAGGWPISLVYKDGRLRRYFL